MKELPTRRTMERILKSAAPDSICNVISRIYFAVEDEKVKDECRLAMSMAKSMSKKLREYKEREKGE